MHFTRVILLCVAILPALAGRSPAQTSFLENDTLRIGVHLGRGGAICHLGPSGSATNLVNIRDLGRYIQQSYYSGPSPFVPPGATQHPAYAGWGWNPVQAGDVYNHPSTVLDYSNDGETLYVRCIPKQWALDDVDAECTLETWIHLAANRAHVRCRLNNARSDTTRYAARHQELPALYTVGTLHRLFSYTGPSPMTGDTLTHIENNGPPWAYWTSTENWAALVDDQDWGIGVYHPGAYLTVGGFHGTPGSGGAYGNNTGYIAPLHTELIDAAIVYEYSYILILGDLEDDIRAYVYGHPPARRPAFDFTHDRCHWRPQNLEDPAPPFAGHWPLVLDAADPKLLGPDGWWDAAAVPELTVIAAYETQNDQASLFFAGEDGVFSGEKRIAFTVIADGTVRNYTVDLAAHPLYAGTITRLRLDPLDQVTAGDSAALLAITAPVAATIPGWESAGGADEPHPPAGRCRPLGAAPVLLSPQPNPSRGSTAIGYALPAAARIDLGIYDLQGRLIRSLRTGCYAPAGEEQIAWDGCDRRGRPAPAGVYLCRLKAGPHCASRALIRLP